uniref:Solute carrier family 25 member 31 n=1 Tax=Otus sunia TaxID=257818 RepID=A0A8C8B9V3_9STRI
MSRACKKQKMCWPATWRPPSPRWPRPSRSSQTGRTRAWWTASCTSPGSKQSLTWPASPMSMNILTQVFFS